MKMSFWEMCLLLFLPAMLNAQQKDPVLVAQAQLDAYNRQDVAAFAAVFAQDAQVFSNLGDEKPGLEGREAIAKRYAELFKNYPQNRSTLIGRMQQGNFVIDHELITGRGNEPVKIVAVYEVKEGLIVRCWFMR